MLIKSKSYKKHLPLIIILILFSIVWIYFFTNFSSMNNQDSYWYVRLAENFGSGNSYTLDGTTPHAQYPPGLPLLVLFFSILPGNIVTGGLIMIFILSMASIILTYKIGNEINKNVGIIATILLASHNLFIFHSMTILTQIPFMFFSTLGLYCFMKSYDKEKRILIIPAIASICLSILMRYDAFLIAIPMIFYIFIRRKDFERFFFSKKTFVGIGVGLLILAPWFLRNFFVFGEFLVNAHSLGDGSTGLSINTLIQFASIFFKTGYIYPYLILIGIIIVLFGTTTLFKKKNNLLELRTYIIWIFIYFILHSWWWARGLTYYAQLLIFFSIFGAISIEIISKKISQKTNLISQKTLIYIILILLTISQIFIFTTGSINQQLSLKNFNQFDPIKEAAEYSNNNLPDNDIYVFPEYVVYTSFLNKPQGTTYMNGLNHLLSTNGTIYFFTDNIHTWITDPFIPKNGIIALQIPTQQGSIKVELHPEEIITFEKESERQTNKATIWKIEGYNIIN